MNSDLTLLTGILAVLWFLVYWVFGGVAFSLLVLLRLGRVRKVRFSCLFTLLSFVLGVGAAYGGVQYSREAIAQCLLQATNRPQIIIAIFGCGFVGIMGAFFVGALALVFIGLLLMLLCRRPRNGSGTTVADDLSNGSRLS